MIFEERIGYWRAELPRIDLEASLGGTADGALPINLEMLEFADEHFESIVGEATAYIAEKVTMPHALNGSPNPEWLECGLSNYGEHHEFELYFTDEDTYTLWSVRFRYGKDHGTGQNGGIPVGFSRREW